MSHYIFDADIKEKIGQVEGPAWMNNQERDLKANQLHYSVYGAIMRWNAENRDPEYFCCTIYGDGGWNRYYVRNDGRVVFSKYHTSHNGIDLATKAGFDIE